MKNLAKILELIRKTGDKYIFEDDKENAFVVLTLADYENLVFQNNSVKNLSEEELLNRINKDIAVWKSNQEDEKLKENWQNFDKVPLKELKETEEADQYYFEPEEDEV